MGQSSPDRPSFTLAAVKAFHTVIWFTIEFAVLYLLYTGIRRKKGPAVTVAASIVALESAVFLGNGARCPLTSVAESLGDEHGSVTDIYLPRWLAKSLPVIHIPLLVLIVWLHRRPAVNSPSDRSWSPVDRTPRR
jgi:hypothetical protein